MELQRDFRARRSLVGQGLLSRSHTILSDAGWALTDGGKGSHEKWRHALSGKTVIVPRSKSRHTANEILRQAGLPKTF